MPKLPTRRPAWSASTRAYWRRLWRSPMAAAYLEADLGALHRLIELVERFERGDVRLLGEQRQLEDRFGLSPKARQLLQWQVLAHAELERAEPPVTATPSVRRLRAVDPQAAAT